MDKTYAIRIAKSDCASYICTHWLGDNNQTIDLHAAEQVQYYIRGMSREGLRGLEHPLAYLTSLKYYLSPIIISYFYLCFDDSVYKIILCSVKEKMKL